MQVSLYISNFSYMVFFNAVHVSHNCTDFSLKFNRTNPLGEYYRYLAQNSHSWTGLFVAIYSLDPIYRLSSILHVGFASHREAIGRIGILVEEWESEFVDTRNENLQGSIEFRPRFASRSFTRDWLTMRTVIHGFSHFNYALLHYGALYYTLPKYTSPLRGLFPPCWLPPSTRFFLSLPPLPSLNFSRSLFPLSKPTLLLEHVPSSFSFFPVLTADRTSTYLSILSGFQTSLATSCIFKFTFSSFSFCVYFPLARLATRRAKQIFPCGFLIIEIE